MIRCLQTVQTDIKRNQSGTFHDFCSIAAFSNGFQTPTFFSVNEVDTTYADIERDTFYFPIGKIEGRFINHEKDNEEGIILNPDTGDGIQHDADVGIRGSSRFRGY